jgi:hypothetical protein
MVQTPYGTYTQEQVNTWQQQQPAETGSPSPAGWIGAARGGGLLPFGGLWGGKRRLAGMGSRKLLAV